MIIGSIVSAGLLFVHFASNRGLFVLMVIFTLSPASAYNRRLIWEHGIDDVLRSPLFGIRPETWTRPFWMKPSIDNYWLFQAMQGGIPSVLLLLLAIMLIIRQLYRLPTNSLPPALEGLRRGWLFLIIAMILCGATVHFFDKLQPYFAFVVATGAAAARILADWERGAGSATATAAIPATPPTATGKPRTWL
jgi:O-antigen ligase